MSTQISDTTLAALQRIQGKLQVRGEERAEALTEAAGEMEELRAGEHGNHPSVLLVRAQLGHARGDREETIEAATALRERTSSPAALIAATRALLASEAAPEAARTAARGLQLAPKDATLRTLAVDACARQGETHAEGAAHLDVLLAQVEELPDRERANAHLAAARLAAAIGATEAAQGHLEWVRALAPTHPGIKAIERQLAPEPTTSAPDETAGEERDSASTESGEKSEAPAEPAEGEPAAGEPATEAAAGEGAEAAAEASEQAQDEAAATAEGRKRRGRRREKDTPAPAGPAAAAAPAAAAGGTGAGGGATGDEAAQAAAGKRGRRRGKGAPAAPTAAAGDGAAGDEAATGRRGRRRDGAGERPKMPGWCWVLCVGYLLLALGAGLAALRVLQPSDFALDQELQIALSAAALVSALQIVLVREALRGSVLSRGVLLLGGLGLVGVQVIDTAASRGVYQIVNAVVGGYAVLLVVLLSSRWFTLTRGVRVPKVLLVAIGIAALVANSATGLVLTRAPEPARALGAGVVSLLSEEPAAVQPPNVRPALPVPTSPLPPAELLALLPQPAELAALGGVDEGAPAGEALQALVAADRTRAQCYGSDLLKGAQSVAGSRIVLDEGPLSYAVVESRARELRRAEAQAVLAELSETRHIECTLAGDLAGFRLSAPALPDPARSAVTTQSTPRSTESSAVYTFPTATPLQMRAYTRYELVAEGAHVVLTQVRIIAVNYPEASFQALTATLTG